MTDQYILQFRDGPDKGTAVTDDGQLGWPAPGIIEGTHPGGQYVKVDEGESIRVPSGDPIRYATYEWRRREGH